MQDVPRDQGNDGYSDVDIDYLGGALTEAASVTPTTSFESFLVATAAYPSIPRTVQEEVEAFYMGDKMPTEIVGAELPYSTACVLEVSLLWRIVFCVCLTRRIVSSVAHCCPRRSSTCND